MKEFFKQCLEDLESLTGLRQLYFLQSDEDGRRKIDVLLMGMVLACESYPYIPEEAQRKIIRDQMVKDQSYEALNSRTVHKWLTTAANSFRAHSQFDADLLTPRDRDGNPCEPAAPEVAEKYMKEFQSQLEKVGRQVPQGRDGVAVRATGYPSTPAEDVERKMLHNQYLRENYHHITREKLPGWQSEEEWIKQHQGV